MTSYLPLVLTNLFDFDKQRKSFRFNKNAYNFYVTMSERLVVNADADSKSDAEVVASPAEKKIRTDSNSTSCAVAKLDEKFSFHRDRNHFHVLIGCTGSVASTKLPELVNQILKNCHHPNASVDVRVVTTENALAFFEIDKLSVFVYRDADEWMAWKQRGDPILHVQLRRWADILVIAPLDANSMAKISNGICDNLLTSVVRAWDCAKPVYICPAMNTYMWEHPITYDQMDKLKNLFGFKEVPCIEKELMCGDRGYGAMASVDMIVSIVQCAMKSHFAIYSDENWVIDLPLLLNKLPSNPTPPRPTPAPVTTFTPASGTPILRLNPKEPACQLPSAPIPTASPISESNIGLRTTSNQTLRIEGVEWNTAHTPNVPRNRYTSINDHLRTFAQTIYSISVAVWSELLNFIAGTISLVNKTVGCCKADDDGSIKFRSQITLYAEQNFFTSGSVCIGVVAST
ncbi:Phosphopantothenoylcysteine decarboxylase [Trichinella papuae]|uniref:Phosphopantothenoylcysteine decarboxylase n=1 Tax=Trichinella papuae TaxID=268474 RepID=A0A0V1N0Y6_9BILA|nr:Phosphopantothenoylcysteine decarboxylase [Trichinella papuae]